jgi:3-deoxy-D-manno-octulosonic-acid transferase
MATPMAERLPLTLSAYRMITGAGTVLAPQLLERRRRRGKEPAGRIGERRGKPSAPRLPGPLIWVHGASVGEFLAALPLIERIRAGGFAVLVTTGTVTSAAIAERRLPAGALHQFIPLDVPAYVTRFLDYWRPGLALFVESDLWPNMILTAAERNIPLMVVNGRLSDRSYDRWRRLPRTIAALLKRFDLCLARSTTDAERFAALGAPRVSVTGNLKFDVPALPADPRKLAALAAATAGRIVFAAASTHPGEEAAIIDVHRRLRGAFSNLLTVIAPRHPARGPAIAELAAAARLPSSSRARDGVPAPGTELYIVDTLGELGLIYRLAPIVFMGGSLVRHGGQNPIEAIKLGAAILHGPHVANFSDIYHELDAGGAAACVADAGALAERVGIWIANDRERACAAAAARRCVDQLGGALENTVAALEPYFLQLRNRSRTAHA